MSTCWWSNNIIIAWTRNYLFFYFNYSSYKGHSISSQFPLDLKNKKKEEINSRMKKEKKVKKIKKENLFR